MFVCKSCDHVFHTEDKLRTHLNKLGTVCKKYEHVLFYCKKCNFKSNGLKTIQSHIPACKGELNSEDIFSDIVKKHECEINNATKEINELRNRLLVEQIKNEYLNQIIYQSTNLKLTDVFTEKEGNLYLKPVEKCPQINVHMKTYIETVTKEVITLTEEVDVNAKKLTKKKKKKYRSVDRKNIKPFNPPNPKKLEVVKTELLSGKDYLNKIESVLNNMSRNSKINQNDIKEIRVQRENLMGVLTINEYTKVTGKINNKFKRIMKGKKLDTCLTMNCLIGTMNSIDMRLINMKEHIQNTVDVDQIDRFSLCFKNGIVVHEEFEETNQDKMFDMFTNYSILYFPLSSLIKQYFDKNTFNNVIYVPFKKSTESLPFSFYTLTNINTNGTRKWDMDSRLEDLSNDFINVVGAYMIKVFRQLYYDVFNDNIYRDGFKSKCPHLENEFEQLSQNLYCLITPVSFSMTLIDIVKTHCTYLPNEQLDTFNLRIDDYLQKEKYKSYTVTESDYYELASKVFDEPTTNDAVSWISSISLY